MEAAIIDDEITLVSVFVIPVGSIVERGYLFLQGLGHVFKVRHSVQECWFRFRFSQFSVGLYFIRQDGRCGLNG